MSIHVYDLVGFLTEKGVDVHTAVNVSKSVNVHGDFTLEVSGVISYNITADARSAIGTPSYDIAVTNLVV